MYKVIKHFIDLHDNDHSYNEGDIFPREGGDVSEERIKELAGSDNKQHTPLIELVEEDPDNTADSLTIHLQNHYDRPFDRIRVGNKTYGVDFSRKLRTKQVYVVSEVM